MLRKFENPWGGTATMYVGALNENDPLVPYPRIQRIHIQIALRTLGTVLDCVPMLLNNFRPSSYAAESNRGLAGA